MCRRSAASPSPTRNPPATGSTAGPAGTPPSSRAADLSYGDLFTLARQRSGPAQEQALWREYLAAFPRGRYADDARAGLCRRAEPDERAACWQQYLTDFPAGVHRPQAERALAEP